MNNLLTHFKRMFKVTLIFYFIFFAKVSVAFNWDKCTKKVGVANGIGLFITTTSYLSSTGACSMLGQTEDQKKYFIAQTHEPLKIDLARGGGEYIFAYAELSGCPINVKKEYSGYLQRNFIKIYGEKLDNSAEEIYDNIDKVIKENKKLSVACSERKLI